MNRKSIGQCKDCEFFAGEDEQLKSHCNHPDGSIPETQDGHYGCWLWKRDAAHDPHWLELQDKPWEVFMRCPISRRAEVLIQSHGVVDSKGIDKLIEGLQLIRENFRDA